MRNLKTFIIIIFFFLYLTSVNAQDYLQPFDWNARKDDSDYYKMLKKNLLKDLEDYPTVRFFYYPTLRNNKYIIDVTENGKEKYLLVYREANKVLDTNGYQKDEIITEKLKAISKSDAQMIISIFTKVVTDARDYETLSGFDGEYYFVTVKNKTGKIWSPSGKMEEFVSIARDLANFIKSDRKDFESEFKLRIKSLESKLK